MVGSGRRGETRMTPPTGTSEGANQRVWNIDEGKGWTKKWWAELRRERLFAEVPWSWDVKGGSSLARRCVFGR